MGVIRQAMSTHNQASPLAPLPTGSGFRERRAEALRASADAADHSNLDELQGVRLTARDSGSAEKAGWVIQSLNGGLHARCWKPERVPPTQRHGRFGAASGRFEPLEVPQSRRVQALLSGGGAMNFRHGSICQSHSAPTKVAVVGRAGLFRPGGGDPPGHVAATGAQLCPCALARASPGRERKSVV